MCASVICAQPAGPVDLCGHEYLKEYPNLSTPIDTVESLYIEHGGPSPSEYQKGELCRIVPWAAEDTVTTEEATAYGTK